MDMNSCAKCGETARPSSCVWPLAATQALFRVNARRLSDAFESAWLAGVERIVFASSNHAFGCYPITESVSPAFLRRPDSL
jgi:nucleoside-diphosphate-sugar epimerase